MGVIAIVTLSWRVQFLREGKGRKSVQNSVMYFLNGSYFLIDYNLSDNEETAKKDFYNTVMIFERRHDGGRGRGNEAR